MGNKNGKMPETERNVVDFFRSLIEIDYGKIGFDIDI